MYTSEALYELSYGTKFNISNTISEYYFQSEYSTENQLYNIGSRIINHSLYGEHITGNLSIGHNLSNKSKISPNKLTHAFLLSDEILSQYSVSFRISK